MATKEELLVIINDLKSIIKDIAWMARRYANGRRTYAVSLCNDAIERAKELGINIPDDSTLSKNKEKAYDPDFD